MHRIELDYVVRYVIFTAQFSYNFLFESYIYPETKAYDI